MELKEKIEEQKKAIKSDIKDINTELEYLTLQVRKLKKRRLQHTNELKRLNKYYPGDNDD